MAIRPEDVLPDGDDHARLGGTQVRKGSVAAFVANARALSTLPPGAERDEVAAQLRALAPALEAAGVFDVFDVRSPDVSAALSG